jgi:predicted secreted acid phosphatase
MSSKLLVVVDIDGTISDGTDRFRYAGPQPSLQDKEAYLSWVEAVNNNMASDCAVPGMLSILRALARDYVHCVYLTNREERHREATEDWLYDQGFPRFELLMREDDTYSEAVAYKGVVIANLSQVFDFQDIIVIDDDPKMKDLCDNKGYTFLQAMSGGRQHE